MKTYQTDKGDIILEPEEPGDAAFTYQLFTAHAMAVLKSTGLGDQDLERLTAMQYRSQTATYRMQFPDARRWIVRWDGGSVGRLVETREARRVHIVYIAFLPAFQRRGLASALLKAMMREWAADGLGARSRVPIDNGPSLSLHRRLGFVETGPATSAHLDLAWTPPSS